MKSDLALRVTDALENGGPCRLQDLATALRLTNKEVEQVEAWSGVVLHGRGWRAMVSLAIEDTRQDSRMVAAALIVLAKGSGRRLIGAEEVAVFLGWEIWRVYRSLGHAVDSWYTLRVERRSHPTAWMPSPVLAVSSAG